MGDLNRKEFLDRILPIGKEEKSTYDINKDEIFLKYSNKTSPLNFKRTRGTLSAYTGAWGEKQKIHLIRRLMFGVKPTDLAALNGLTMSQSVDLLLNTTPPTPTPPLNYYNALYADVTGIPLGGDWTAAAYGDGTVDYYRHLSTQGWWMRNIHLQSVSIMEKMILFWSNFLPTSWNSAGNAAQQYQYLKLLRTNALGNYKTFIKDITKNVHMLLYLNGHYNIKNSPDENYARELQELFTIGKDPTQVLYSEADVQAAAKVLTGYRVLSTSNAVGSFDSTKHDTTNKQFSSFYNNTVIAGQAGAAGENELDELLNMIFAKDTIVASTLCRKLYRFFVYYDIDATIESTIISGMASTLIANNWEIKPVLQQLFKSDHFFDTVSMDCLIRTPIDFYMGFMRTTDIKIDLSTLTLEEYYRTYIRLAQFCEQTGMDPGEPPTVSGWPAYYQTPQFHEMWINSDTLPRRMKYTDLFFTSYGHWVTTTWQLKCDSLAFAKTLLTPSDPVALVDQVVKYFVGLTFSQPIKDSFKLLLLDASLQNSSWTNAWNDYLNNPGNTAMEGIVRTRLNDMMTKLLQMAEHQLI